MFPSKLPNVAAPRPPTRDFLLTAFPSSVGDLAAYVTPAPGDGVRHPAIVWLTGGDCNSIGDVWTPSPPNNDQTASAFRQQGVVMFFPSLRGGNVNPGQREGLFGEVDDVLAAASFVRALPYVDPRRVYLGGHSTGGTLALLVSEVPNPFRAVFAFGPIADVRAYKGTPYVPFDLDNPNEVRLRSPAGWLDGIQTPTVVVEGDKDPSNIDQLRLLAATTVNPRVTFVSAPGVDHFSVLKPLTRQLAGVVATQSADSDFAFTPGADLKLL